MVWLPVTPGLGTIVHDEPLARSTSVVSEVAVNELSPTAVQLSAVGQLIPHRALSTDPGGFGLGSMDHRSPFQRSISVFGGIPLWLSQLPAATHDFGPAQDTDCKVASRPSGGSGAGTSTHSAPFHCCPIGTLWPPASPTALQLDADAHETDHSSSLEPMFSVPTMDHEVPFHRSASVLV
jgi:hypothetical protein